ncbi:MAG: hypothetical protein V4689_09560 [Verrucomicrobiota bacterium]
MKSTLRFSPGGLIDCLYTEAIDLHQLGRLHVVRATDIRFNDQTQEWETRHADTGEVLFSNLSRAACLQWEHENLQPQSRTHNLTNQLHPIPMKQIIILAFSLLIAACGPNKTQLRSELQSIDSEMVNLRIAAEQHRSKMDQAEYVAFIGSFAAGYGATSGNYELAGDGADTAVRSSRQYDASSYSLDQLKQRYEVLAKRRTEIVKQLN